VSYAFIPAAASLAVRRNAKRALLVIPPKESKGRLARLASPIAYRVSPFGHSVGGP
jgi:hypothetical protein